MSAVQCIVPFCAKTKAGDARFEWICGDHWPSVPSIVKRGLTRARKRNDEPGFRLLWAGAKRYAIERAAGIRR